MEDGKIMISLVDLLEEVVDELDEKYKTKGNLGKWLRQKWVDISRKDGDGKHPSCGDSAGKKTRGKSGSRAYPKCRPARSAAAMTSKEKSSAVTRKRKAGNPGGKPTMVKTYTKSK
jgi:hypothetical protein